MVLTVHWLSYSRPRGSFSLKKIVFKSYFVSEDKSGEQRLFWSWRKKKQQCCERNRKKKESGSKRKNRTNSILCGHVAPYFVEAKKQRRYRDCLGPGTAQHSPEKHTCTCTQTHTHACMHTVLEVLSAVWFSRGCTPSLTVRDSSCFRRIKILTWVQQSCRHRRDEYQKVQRKCWINRKKTVTYHAVATCFIVLHAGEF